MYIERPASWYEINAEEEALYTDEEIDLMYEQLMNDEADLYEEQLSSY